MKNRINDKIQDIEKFLEELEVSLPENFKQYEEDFKLRAIGERYFEKIIEAVVDLSFFIIRLHNLRQPDEDKVAFDVLSEAKIISNELSEKLKNAKGMRNIIAHEYGRIDNELVFNSLVDEIIPDVESFLEEIDKSI